MSLPNTNITVGAPPLLWSDVNEAFTRINENFDSITASLGVAGITPINFETLDTSLKPTVDNLYELGDITHKWRAVFTGEHTVVDTLNGLWAGNAQIKGVGYTVNLPANSTVGGDPITGVGADLIIDPDKTFFKEIQVNNDLSVVATTFGDTVNFLSGSGVGLAVSSGADSITFSNTGILSVAAGTGITAATVSGVATVTNAGVRSLQSTTALPSGRTAGAGVNINGATGDNLKVTNTGVISISSGVGITVSLDAASGDVTITNAAPAVNAFTQVEVDGDSGNRLQADAASDVLKINSGLGITLSKTDIANEDILTIAVNPVFDLRGSVFADDSTVMVDAVSGTLRGIFIGSVFTDSSTQIIDGNTATVYGNIEATTLRTAETKIALGSTAGATTQGTSAIAIGWFAGNETQGINSVAIGTGAGATTQGTLSVAVGASAGNTSQGFQAVAIGTNAGNVGQGINAVAVGISAGQNNQGANAIAIGSNAGAGSGVGDQQAANTIILNATGSIINGVASQTNSFYVAPIRTTANGTPLMYNATTKEITYSNVLEFVGSTISTSDSSGLTVDVQTTFNTDVTFDNDVAVTGRVTIGGDLIINGTTTTINSVTLTVDDKNIELGSTGSPTDVTADGGGITLKGTTDKTFNYVNSTGLWTANIGVQATSFTGLAAAATTASTAASVGYIGLPQSATATTATLAIGDTGKHIYVNTSGQTITIPAATSVAYPVGTTITFIAGPSAGTVTIAIATDTMYLIGTGTTGSRTLAAHGMATAVKVSGTSSSGVWYINGSGLT
jgi:hypothetical protein